MESNMGQLGVGSFLASLFLGSLSSSLLFSNQSYSIVPTVILQAGIELFLLTIFYWRYRKRGLHFQFEVTARSSILGSIASIGLRLSIVSYLLHHHHLLAFGIYLLILSGFHFSEFVTTAFTNSGSLTVDSFLLNQSAEYHLALAISIGEYFLESWQFVPGWKFHYPSLSLLGVAVCLCGEVIRKMAMVTAGRNFNHIIQYERDEEHILITDGIYGQCRHPSYVGWFMWSVGTQILLQNPISLIGYTIVSWKFFKERIEYEEYTLINFFGENYRQYKKRVPSGLPFISGYSESFGDFRR